jgi:hypothetical protein
MRSGDQALLSVRPKQTPRDQVGASSVRTAGSFTCEQKDSVLSPDNEIWLAAKGLYVPALLQIAPASSAVRWPPDVVFTVPDLKPLAGRLRQGLPLRT